MSADPPPFTRACVVTCLVTFLFYLSFHLILPVMPLYVAAMGTFYAAREFGIMTGSAGAGLLLEVADFPAMLLAGSLPSLRQASTVAPARSAP